jgi:hypothetical protein
MAAASSVHNSASSVARAAMDGLVNAVVGFFLDKVKTRVFERGGPVKVSEVEHALDIVVIKAASAACLAKIREL